MKPNVSGIPDFTRSRRRTFGVTDFADWCVYPECGKGIRQKRLNSHLSLVHKIKSVLVTSDANLLNHSIASHPVCS